MMIAEYIIHILYRKKELYRLEVYIFIYLMKYFTSNIISLIIFIKITDDNSDKNCSTLVNKAY